MAIIEQHKNHTSTQSHENHEKESEEETTSTSDYETNVPMSARGHDAGDRVFILEKEKSRMHRDKRHWDFAPFAFDETESANTSRDDETEDHEYDILKAFDTIFSPPELSELPELNEYTIEGKPYLDYIKSLECVIDSTQQFSQVNKSVQGRLSHNSIY